MVMVKCSTDRRDLASQKARNPYWRLGSKQVQRWGASAIAVQQERALHHQRIAADQAAARASVVEDGCPRDFLVSFCKDIAYDQAWVLGFTSRLTVFWV